MKFRNVIFLPLYMIISILSSCSYAARYVPIIIPGQAIKDKSWIPLNIEKPKIPEGMIDPTRLNPDHGVTPLEKVDPSQLKMPPGTLILPDMFEANSQIFGGMDSSEYQKIDELVGSEIGDKFFPYDELFFLYAKTEDQGIHGPLTILSFSFAGPLNGFNPKDEIKVSLDGDDISGKMQYEHFTNYQRGAAYFRGQYFPFDYIDPSRSHTMKITFNIKNGGVYYKNVKFKIGKMPEVKIQLAGFSIDPVTKETQMDSIGVMLYVPETQQFSENIETLLKNPRNWIIEWEDKAPVPEIKSVDGGFGTFTLHLASKLEKRNKVLSIRVRIGKNLLSEPCKLKI